MKMEEEYSRNSNKTIVRISEHEIMDLKRRGYIVGPTVTIEII